MTFFQHSTVHFGDCDVGNHDGLIGCYPVPPDGFQGFGGTIIKPPLALFQDEEKVVFRNPIILYGLVWPILDAINYDSVCRKELAMFNRI